MQINFPPIVRQTIYIIVVIGTSIIVPLNSFHIVNDVIMAVWASFSGAASLLASLNVDTYRK